MAIAANIQTVQGFLGYFNPAQTDCMARGCRVQTEGKLGDKRATRTSEGVAAGPVGENIQTMQGFLGYFDPSQAERMAQGCRVESRGQMAGAKEQVADEWLMQALSALQDVFRDWEISIEEAKAEGERVAVHFAVPNHR